MIREIDLAGAVPLIKDASGNKFAIDFVGNKTNYSRKKAGISTELIGRAMGAGRYGKRVLDLSAGLGIDAVFLAQLGFSVVAVERNPLIWLSLNEALKQSQLDIEFVFGEALSVLAESKIEADIIYFDPMFPEKSKSALPRQEMVFFKKLVGGDEDSVAVLQKSLQQQGVKRVVVKRPLKAPFLGERKPQSSLKGKLIRFDIYGVKS